MNDARRQAMAWMRQARVHVSPARLADRQCHPHIDFANLAQFTVLDQLFDCLHRLVEAIVVILDNPSAM